MVGREFAVTGLRAAASAQGFAISAIQLGKYKMVAQVACIGCLIIAHRYPETLLYRTGRLLLWLVLALALLSMFQYFRRFWRFIEAAQELPSNEQ